MFTQFGQRRHGSRLVAWLSVLGLIIAMFAASIQPAAAATVSEGDVSVVVRGPAHQPELESGGVARALRWD